jgi:hypothetical protein
MLSSTTLAAGSLGGSAQWHVSAHRPTLNCADELECALTNGMPVVQPGNLVCECANASFTLDLRALVRDETCALALGATSLHARRTIKNDTTHEGIHMPLCGIPSLP